MGQEAQAKTVPPRLAAWKKQEAEKEAQEYYWPRLLKLSDGELMGELSHLYHEVTDVHGLPYREGSVKARQLEKMLKRRFSVKEGNPIPTFERYAIMRACSELRKRIVPFYPVKANVANCVDRKIPRQTGLFPDSDWRVLMALSLAGADKLGKEDGQFFRRSMAKARRIGPERFSWSKIADRARAERLCFRSQWHLAQALVSLIGARRYDEESDLPFLADIWERAHDLGPTEFRFSQRHKIRAEKIFDKVAFADHESCPEQVDVFKSMVMRLSGVPVWRSAWKGEAVQPSFVFE